MRNGAVNGVPMAAVMLLASLSSMYGDRVAVIGLLSPILMLGVPALAFVLMRRDSIRSRLMFTVGGLWLDGALSFICGALLSSLVMFVVWRWLDPTWMQERIDQSIDFLSSSPEASMQQLARDLRTAVDNGLDLSARTLTMSFLWMASFSGCVVSLILAPIVRALTPKNITH